MLFRSFWRFTTVSQDGVGRMISRDLDSLLNWREKAAVDDWVASGMAFHVMRDNPSHDTPILGGMWGCAGGLLPMDEMVDRWMASVPDSCKHGSDQLFLSKEVWPIVRTRAISHGLHGTQFPCAICRPFPGHAPIPFKFVGETVL